MDVTEIKALISQGKGQRLAWHPQDVSISDLAATLVALANSKGGTLLIGLTPQRGQLQNLADPQESVDRAIKAILRVTPPLIVPLPQIAEVEGQAVLYLDVPAGLPHVYSLEGQYLCREGAGNQPLSPRALRRLMMARGELSWEAQTPPGATAGDLNWDEIIEYVQGIDGVGDATVETVLIRRGCVIEREGQLFPTFASILLFGHEPARWVRGSEIEAARFSGREMGEAFVRQTIGGTLPQQLRQAEAFLTDHMRKVVHMGEGLQRQERPEYPPQAAREALVNAVAHRDYSISGDQIRVFMFADRLEVTSPGRLPGPVTVENIVEERFSRNEVIVQVLADMGFIERLGYGIDRMIQLMEAQQLPPPRFQETAGGFRVVLFGARDKGAETAPAFDLQAFAHLALNARQEQAITYLLSQRRITNRDYQTLCSDVHPETLRRDLADLVKKDVLLKIGAKRATYYILKKSFLEEATGE